MGRLIVLSDSQANLLHDICSLEFGRPISRTYRPALKLIEYGYAEFKERRFSDYLTPTDAGRLADALLQSREASHG